MSPSSEKRFKALNEFVQIRPLKDEKKSGGIVLASVTKAKESRGVVVSVGEGRRLADGTLVHPGVEVNDVVIYNPHMVGHEVKDETGADTVIISATGIYGKMV